MSIIFPIIYIAIAEYNPISTFLKKITFKSTMIISTITIKLPVLKCGLYERIIYDNISVPPVDACAFSIIAVPIPIHIPP